MAPSPEESGKRESDDPGKAPSRGEGRTAGMPPAARARKRAVRRGANVHLQDEDQAPTGKNAGDERAATEANESRGQTGGERALSPERVSDGVKRHGGHLVRRALQSGSDNGGLRT